jgi:hypothetical protein
LAEGVFGFCPDALLSSAVGGRPVGGCCRHLQPANATTSTAAGGSRQARFTQQRKVITTIIPAAAGGSTGERNPSVGDEALTPYPSPGGGGERMAVNAGFSTA